MVNALCRTQYSARTLRVLMPAVLTVALGMHAPLSLKLLASCSSSVHSSSECDSQASSAVLMPVARIGHISSTLNVVLYVYEV
jgi:hypothetical protein